MYHTFILILINENNFSNLEGTKKSKSSSSRSKKQEKGKIKLNKKKFL